MKKLFLGLLLLPFFAFTAADWITVKLDERAVVDFPAEPEKSDIEGNAQWIQDVDKDARCMAMIVDFKNLGMDSVQLAAEIVKEQSFIDFRQGVLKQMPGATLISEKKGTIAGKMYFEYLIKMNKSGQPDTFIVYNRNIFAGDKLYILSFYEKNNLPREPDRNKFFASFRLLY